MSPEKEFDEVAGWRSMLHSIRHMPQWDELTDDGQCFLKKMQADLLAEANGRPNLGDRRTVARPFENAVDEVLKRRGIATKRPAEAIEIAGRRKQADMTFEWWKKRWVIEFKTGLSFDSLASAALEGVAYLRKKQADRFLIVSLYDSFNGEDDPESMAMQTLKECGVETEGLELFIITRRFDYCEKSERYSLMVERLSRFLAALPKG